MPDEALQQASGTLDYVKTGFGTLAQLNGIFYNEIGQLVVFRMSPTSFNWVHVRRITRKSKGLDSILFGKKRLYHLCPMDWSAIPNQLDGTGNLLTEVPKKINNQLPVEVVVSREHLKKESFLLGFGTDRDRPDGRYLSPLVPRRQLRRFATWRQRPPSSWHHLKTSFVGVYQGRTFFFGFFFISGSSSDSHCSTLLGSRSRATFSGR